MDLKEDIIRLAKELPIIHHPGASSHWEMVCNDVKNKIILDNLDNFLKWHNIVETMFINSSVVAEYEFKEISKSCRWPTYEQALMDLWVGNPPPSSILPFTNNNAIHQMYHIHMYEEKFGPINNATKIVEFGGGYGCLCSLINKLGFTGQYVIIDFPEFHLIQKYYLNKLKITNFIQKTTPDISDFSEATFFAFWSLSESSAMFRQNFVNTYFSGLKNFLMTYQTTYESHDNTAFFNSLKALPNFTVSEIHLEHIPQNFYIFGQHK